MREAAERLGISKEAVRKRVQRGTLPHGRRSDGSVYVCLDAETGTGRDTEAKKPDASTQYKPTFNLTEISTLLTVFAGMASLIYVLGLFVLWAPIAQTYTHDFLAGWHAVSLVPRTVVAGLGVQQLVVLPLFLMALTYVFIGGVEFLLMVLRRLVNGNLGRGRKKKSHSDNVRLRCGARLLACTTTGWGLITFYISWHGVKNFQNATIGQQSAALSDVILLWGLGVIPWGIGIIVLLLSCAFSACVISGNEQTIAPLLTWLPNAKRKAKRPPRARVSQGHTADPTGGKEGDTPGDSTRHTNGKLDTKMSRGNLVNFTAALLLWSLIIYAFWLILSNIEPWFLRLGEFNSSSEVDNYAIVFLVLCVSCIGVAYTAFAYTVVPLPRRKARSLYVAWEEWFTALDSREQVLKRLVIVGFVLSFLMAFLLTFLRTPPLPTVKVMGDVRATGKLLAHTDGFWYVYTGDSTGEVELIAVPDSKVKMVRVVRGSADFAEAD